MKDFFVSYTSQDQAWAEWIAFKLEEAGYSTIIQLWDFAPGGNFIDLMDQAALNTRRTIGVLSEAYLSKAFPRAEFSATFAEDPLGRSKKFIPVRIHHFELKGLLAPIVFIDLAGKDEEQASTALQDGVKHSYSEGRAKPVLAPDYPGSESPNAGKKPFPAPASQSHHLPSSTTVRLKRFLNSRVAAADWLQVALVGNPYLTPAEPTDELFSRASLEIHCYIWTPTNEYFTGPTLQAFTPVVVVCTARPEFVKTQLVLALTLEEQRKLDLAPGKLFNQDREKIYPAIGRALADCFVAAVTIPQSVLLGAHSHTPIAYQTIADLILVPLLDMHRKLAIGRMLMFVSEVGEESVFLLSTCKRLSKAILGKSRILNSVELAGRNSDHHATIKISRHLAWAVGRHHNHGDEKWVRSIEQELDKLGATPSRLDRIAPD